MSAYLDFIARKTPRVEPAGFEPGPVRAPLFPFQVHNVEWALRQGRAALFLDTGLGKTVQQLEWARQVAAHTGTKVLVLAPLAVAQQTVREAARFGFDGVGYAPDQSAATTRIVVTNYDRLDRFDPKAFGGVVLDESSILKSYVGATKRALLEAFADTPFRLACSATPAPNDHVELGNHSEFLGVMKSGDMLTRWFLTDTTEANSLRLKHHAVEDFWNWVASWSVMASLPSDLGEFDDAGYVLPALETVAHAVDVEIADGRSVETGHLFRMVDLNATSVHAERRRTAAARATRVAELVAEEPSERWLVWCETDYEADALMDALRPVVPGVREVRGSDSLTRKEECLVAFSEGRVPCLVTKPKIAGFGLNWQHVARVAFVGATFSFESYYQAIRRTWRFGQTRPVHVHVVMATTERPVWAILERKRREFEVMKRSMFAAARRRRQPITVSSAHDANEPVEAPIWMRRA